MFVYRPARKAWSRKVAFRPCTKKYVTTQRITRSSCPRKNFAFPFSKNSGFYQTFLLLSKNIGFLVSSFDVASELARTMADDADLAEFEQRLASIDAALATGGLTEEEVTELTSLRAQLQEFIALAAGLSSSSFILPRVIRYSCVSCLIFFSFQTNSNQRPVRHWSTMMKFSDPTNAWSHLLNRY